MITVPAYATQSSLLEKIYSDSNMNNLNGISFDIPESFDGNAINVCDSLHRVSEYYPTWQNNFTIISMENLSIGKTMIMFGSQTP
jgi:uncharacterized protein (UPF0333 family)